jgi:hypothetical protein
LVVAAAAAAVQVCSISISSSSSNSSIRWNPNQHPLQNRNRCGGLFCRRCSTQIRTLANCSRSHLC